MRAAAIINYGEALVVDTFPDPIVPRDGVVLRVDATGICRSDWHAWMGHETLPGLPHVPGHEMVGVVEEIGADVTRWGPGDRVTVPFSIGCGECRSCRSGSLNICDVAFTPGFSHWGSFAELVAIHHADANLVSIPPDLDSVPAAALGCRFVTSFRAVVDRGRLRPGEWLAVHGCGGVGLSAVMIGAALGARVVALDIDAGSLARAAELGAEVTIEVGDGDPAATVVAATDGGAHVSIDAVGGTSTALASLRSLRKRGRHVQVGLMLAGDATLPIPMEPVIMNEVEILGSRGMPATDYPRVFELLTAGAIDLRRLVGGTVSLDGASAIMQSMGDFAGVGVTVIDISGRAPIPRSRAPQDPTDRVEAGQSGPVR